MGQCYAQADTLRRMGKGQCCAQRTHIEADGEGAVPHRAHALRRMGMGQCYAQPHPHGCAVLCTH